MREIERKWRIGRVDSYRNETYYDMMKVVDMLEKVNYIGIRDITQSWLLIEDGLMIRVRKEYSRCDSTTTYTMTTKISNHTEFLYGLDGPLDRTELEQELTEEEYNIILERCKYTIHKIRIDLPLHSSIDIFTDDQLKGVVLFEREYEDEEDTTKYGIDDLFTELCRLSKVDGETYNYNRTIDEVFDILTSYWSKGKILEVTNNPIYKNENLCRSEMRESFNGEVHIVKREL